MCDSRANAFIHVTAYRGDLKTKASFTFNRIPSSPSPPLRTADFDVVSSLDTDRMVYTYGL